MNQDQVRKKLNNLEKLLPEPKAIALVAFGKYLANTLPQITSEQDFKTAYMKALLDICHGQEDIPEIFQANYRSVVELLNLLYPTVKKIVFQ